MNDTKHVVFDKERDEFRIFTKSGRWVPVYNGSSILDFPNEIGATDQAKVELDELLGKKGGFLGVRGTG